MMTQGLFSVSLQRRILSRLNRSHLIDKLVYTARHGPARGLRRQGGMGWLPAFTPHRHEWDAEEAFLDGLDWRGLTVYDVGGDQGLFTLFFARRVGRDGKVVVFEPNPRSYSRITRNVELNGFDNVRLVPRGLGERRERVAFTYPADEPARGTARPAFVRKLRRRPTVINDEIDINSLDDEISGSGLPAPDFIKLDVEGYEYPVLKGMAATLRDQRPRLSIEIHGNGDEDKLANAAQVVSLLEDAGYRIRHIESGTDISRDNLRPAREGHLYCVHRDGTAAPRKKSSP